MEYANELDLRMEESLTYSISCTENICFTVKILFWCTCLMSIYYKHVFLKVKP